MLKKLSLVMLMLLFGAGLVLAQEKSAADTSIDPAQTEQIKGTIEKVDLTLHKITIKPAEKVEVKEFSFDDKTTFWNKNKELKADSLKVGDNVTVEINLMNVATKVSVVPKEMASEPNN